MLTAAVSSSPTSSLVGGGRVRAVCGVAWLAGCGGVAGCGRGQLAGVAVVRTFCGKVSPDYDDFDPVVGREIDCKDFCVSVPVCSNVTVREIAVITVDNLHWYYQQISQRAERYQPSNQGCLPPQSR